MSLTVTLNGSVYIIPETNEVGWGGNTTSYLVAIPAGVLQKTGGSFLLSAETDFGGAFGLKSLYYKSRSANVAATGILRLNNNSDAVSWRNAANSGDLPLTVDTSDRLLYNGSPVLVGAGPSSYVSSITGTANQVIASSPTGAVTLSLPQSINTSAAVQFGTLGLGSAPVASSILSLTSTTLGFLPPRMTTVERDAIVSPATGLLIYNTTTGVNNYYNGTIWTAIAAGGTINPGTQYQLSYYAVNGSTLSGLPLITGLRALQSDVNGLPVASTVTTTELGYVSGVTSAIQTQLNTKATDSLVVHLAGTEIITGQKTFSVPTLHTAGTVSLPGISFSADPDTGIRLPVANSISIVANGEDRIAVQSDGQIQINPENSVFINSDNPLATNPGYVTIQSGIGTGIYCSKLGYIVGVQVQETAIGNNGYVDTSEITRYVAAGFMTWYALSTGGDHNFYNDPSGLAGAIVNAGEPTLRFSIRNDGHVEIIKTTNQLVLGGYTGGPTTSVVINAPNPATTSRTWTIPDLATNATFAALEAAQTFTGQKTFNAATLHTAGTVSLPGIAFSADTDTGIRLPTGNSISLVTNATDRMGVDSAGNSYVTAGVLKFDNGSVSAPVVTFASDPDTGLYYIGTNSFGATANGTNVATFSSAGVSILGTTTNGNAAAGYVGQQIESVISTFTNYPTSTQFGDLTSISLTAGDWDVSAMIEATLNGATLTGDMRLGISTTAGNSTTGLVQGTNLVNMIQANTLYDSPAVIPVYRISLTATTTVYLKYRAAFSAGTPQATGRISARRMR